jgi:HEAT repeat protein
MRLFKPNVAKMEANRDVEGLIHALSDKDNIVRMGAARALGWIGDVRAVQALKKALKDNDSAVRVLAEEALKKLESPDVEALKKALKDNDENVRRNAVEQLKRIGGDWAAESLIATLNDPAVEVRKAAAKSLGNIGSKAAIGSLIYALEDQDHYVGWTAAEALDKIDDPDAKYAVKEYREKEKQKAEKEEKKLIAEIKNKSGTYSAKDLADRINDRLGRPVSKSLIVCQFCHKFLGYNEDVMKNYAYKTTEDYRRRAEEAHIHLLSEYLFRCPNCGKENLL